MGIDIAQGPSSRRMQPRATCGRTLPNELIAKTIRIFHDYDKIPLNLFSQLYSETYDEILDASALAFDNGLRGFLEYTQMVDVEQTEDGLMCRLKDKKPIIEHQLNSERVVSKQIRTMAPQSKREQHHWLFDPADHYLWQNYKADVLKLLKIPPEDIVIALSPLEMALQRNPNRVQSQLAKIQDVLSRFPNGLRLNEINTHVTIDKVLFNTTSMASMVVEYPEIFYAEPEIDGQDRLVYDARLKTESDLRGLECRKCYKSKAKYLRMIAFSLVSGLYQKTLILIRAAGPIGLKLASWHQSIKINFSTKLMAEEVLLDLPPLDLMRTWAFSGLIQLHSPDDCKNDLRLLLPTKKIDFGDFLVKIQEEIHADKKKEREDRWSRIRSYDTLTPNSSGCATDRSSPSSDDKDSD